MESLPSEIITQILEYLPFQDRRVLARVNKVFYHASSHPLFARQETFIYESSRNNLNNFNNFKDMLWKLNRKLLCLSFIDLSFIDDLTIFTNLGNLIISLDFKDLHFLNDSFLDAIAQYCCNLEKLVFTILRDIFLTDKDRKPMLKLRCIILQNVRLSDRDFNQILKLAPNLKDLSIFDCHLMSNNLIIRRFYPHSSNIDYSFTKYNSDFIISEINIVHHLNNSVCLNSLSLNECSSIIYLIQPILLGLKSLRLDFSIILSSHVTENNNRLILALGQCVSLEQLSIIHLPVNMLSTVSKLFNLRHLSLTFTDSILTYSNDECIRLFMESLKNFKYIRSLKFARDSVITDVNDPIYPIPECKLKALASLDCSLHSNLDLLKFGKNLTSLRIRNGEILGVEDFLSLFRNHTNLNHLWIDNCGVITDEIFIQLPISNLKKLQRLQLRNTKISHRSLRHITNTSLKVLVITNLSLLVPGESQRSTLFELQKSVHILSLAVPLLAVLRLRIDFMSMKAFESAILTHNFQSDYLALLKIYFKKLKIIEFY